MDPATLTAIAVSILLNWGFSMLTNPDQEQKAVRQVCQRRIEGDEVEDGHDILQPVWCDEVVLKNGEILQP